MKTKIIQGQQLSNLLSHVRLQRGVAFGTIILTALIAFEIFNYSTTDFALSDLIGDLQFVGLRWATILAIAFCGIDFAGIARLFTPEKGSSEISEIWYLFGAWLLAATMNALLTWWGISIAILNHQTLGNQVVEREVLLRVVPIFVAVMVWLMRVLIIGAFSVAGQRLFSQDKGYKTTRRRAYPQVVNSSKPATMMNNHNHHREPQKSPSKSSHSRNVGNLPEKENTNGVRQDPTYHHVSMKPRYKPAVLTRNRKDVSIGFSPGSGVQVQH